MHITILTLGLPTLFAGLLATESALESMAPTSSGEAIAGAEAVATRRFDLSALRIARSPAIAKAVQIPVLPLMHSMPGADNRGVEPHEFDYTPDDALVQMFSEHRQDQLESIEFVSETVLEIVGPPAILDEFATLVDLVESAVFDSTPLKVIRYVEEGDGPSGIVSMDALEAHLANTAEVRSRRTMQLSPGQVNELHDVVGHDVVIGLDIQIAQGSAVSDSVTAQLASGTSLWTVAARNGRGLLLGYGLSSTQHEEMDGDGLVSGDFMLSTEQGGMRTLTGFEWEEPFGLVGGVVAGEVELLPGEALVLAVGPMGGETRECVALCLPKGSNVSFAGDTRSIGGDHSIWAGPAGSTALPGLRVEDFPESRASATERNTQELGSPLAAVTLSGSDTRFTERLDQFMDSFGVAEIPGSMLVTVPTKSLGLLKDCVAASFEQDAARFNVRISASADDEPLTQVGGLSLRSGRAAAISAGTERLIADENDVEVAQFAGCHDPRIITHFEGLNASLSLIQLSGGRIAYSIKGSLSTDIDEDELTIFGTEGMTAVTSQMLILNDSGTRPKDADGGWTILLGDESGQGQRIELKVRPVR